MIAKPSAHSLLQSLLKSRCHAKIPLVRGATIESFDSLSRIIV
jgi:hypothetical protein